MRVKIISLCFALFVTVSLTGANWLQFRGTETNGVAKGEQPPTQLDKPTWKTKLVGRGLSGPIVVGDRVYLTASSGTDQDRLHVICFDAKSGDQLWDRQFWATGRTGCHNKMCVATPTPASDGKHIFAFYSSNDLACLDLEGNLLWFRGITHDYPNASLSLGMASSPVVVDETVIVQVENEADSLALGIDVNTGKHRWKIDRPRRANWSSPILASFSKADDPLVLMQGSAGVTALKPETGQAVWSYDNGAATISSSAFANGVVYIPSNGLTALKPADADKPEVLWRQARLSPSTASPLVYEGSVYALNRAGVLASADLKSGERDWQLRLTGPFSSTPVAANGHIYLFSERGLAQVVKPGKDKGELVSKYDLGETILCTPAIAGDAIYIRSDGHLWKFAR